MVGCPDLHAGLARYSAVCQAEPEAFEKYGVRPPCMSAAVNTSVVMQRGGSTSPIGSDAGGGMLRHSVYCQAIAGKGAGLCAQGIIHTCSRCLWFQHTQYPVLAGFCEHSHICL